MSIDRDDRFAEWSARERFYEAQRQAEPEFERGFFDWLDDQTGPTQIATLVSGFLGLSAAIAWFGTLLARALVSGGLA